jgi:predicted NBD/HSP70 family sugar kinase
MRQRCLHRRSRTDGRACDSGEWGHNPPSPRPHEIAVAPKCYCGRVNCIESWISGTGLSADFNQRAGRDDPLRLPRSLRRATRLRGPSWKTSTIASRCVARIVNILDPDAIVIGGACRTSMRFTLNCRRALVLRLHARGPHADRQNMPAIQRRSRRGLAMGEEEAAAPALP